MTICTMDGWHGAARGKPSIGKYAIRRAIALADRLDAMVGKPRPTAKRAGSRTRHLVLHGRVTCDVLNSMIAEDLVGPGTVILNKDFTVHKPIAVGETVISRTEITEVRGDKPICHVRAIVTDSDGAVCLEGQATTYTMPAADAQE